MARGFIRGTTSRRSPTRIEHEEVFVNVHVKEDGSEKARSRAGRGEIFAWCWYDFANSAFVTICSGRLR